MTRTQKDLTQSLRFQLSLLRLAVVPHGQPEADNGLKAAVELSKLSDHVAEKPSRRARTSS